MRHDLSHNIFPFLLLFVVLAASYSVSVGNEERAAKEYIACPVFGGEFGALFADSVMTCFVKSKMVQLVERTQIDKALKEMKLESSGITDPGTAQKLGKMVNARFVLIGNSEITPGRLLQLTTRLVRTETAELVPGVAEKTVLDPNHAQDWEQNVEHLAQTLLRQMCDAGITHMPSRATSLTVTSDPPGAEVWLNGEKRGTTPLTVPLQAVPLEGLDCRIELSLAKHQAVLERTRLLPGDQRTLALALHKTEDARPNRVNKRDNATLIFIPGGKFSMGSDGYEKDEAPQQAVSVTGYWMYKYEVTVAQYRKFCQATDRLMPQAPPWGWCDTHPIVNIMCEDAAAYAQWTGGRLPTEAEWEKAARGNDGRLYPWGNDWDLEKCNNWNDHSIAGGGFQQNRTAPVGSYPLDISPYGVYDMGGNVSEWCSDWYAIDYYAQAPLTDPTGPRTGTAHTLRGGNWYCDDAKTLRVAKRTKFIPGYGNFSRGFRCVVPSGE